MVEVYGVELYGKRFCQSLLKISLFLFIESISYAKARVTTSASRPSITALAWLPEPPWTAG